MKNSQLFRIFGAIALALLFIVSCHKDVGSASDEAQPLAEEATLITYQGSQVIPGGYIVVLKDAAGITDRAAGVNVYEKNKATVREIAEEILQSLRIETEKLGFVYGTALKGFSLTGLSEEEALALAAHPRVSYVEQDQTFSVSMGGPPGGGGGGGSSQTTPWGITRVGGAANGVGKRAWIIDTGIDIDHPDLSVDVANGWSAWTSGPNAGPDDKNGHGTHVAGTVAAIDNTEGVIGVAAGASVVPVKVLDRNGSGSNSGVIAGVDYVAASASGNDAANMSLGGGASTALDNAVIAASNACPFALAAGNSSAHAGNYSPARANGPNIYTIASMTSSDTWSSFSNFGQPPVDYIAPGSSVYSTYKDGGYATLSGTSMAAPHVCGILLLGNVNNGGTVTRVAGDVYTVSSR